MQIPGIFEKYNLTTARGIPQEYVAVVFKESIGKIIWWEEQTKKFLTEFQKEYLEKQPGEILQQLPEERSVREFCLQIDRGISEEISKGFFCEIARDFLEKNFSLLFNENFRANFRRKSRKNAADFSKK